MKHVKKQLALILAMAMVATSMFGWQGEVNAAAKPKLSTKKISTTVGKTKKLSVKNAKGAKIKWTVKSKKIAKITKSGKYAVKVKALKKGSTTVTCKVTKGKKKATLKCTVKVAAKASVTPVPATSAPSTEPVVTPTAVPTATPYPSMDPIKDVYKELIPNMGNCLSLNQLQDEKLMAVFEKHFNSFTLENEMKPEAILKNDSLVKTTDAKTNTADYVIPSSYKETTVPRLNFAVVDQALAIAASKGIKVRAHTLVWHSQTPEWFFKENYSASGAYVTTDVMNARMEMYIESVMTHVYTLDGGKYKDTVYAWDVVNEYMHRNRNGNWDRVYKSELTDHELEPTYVKKAFEIADATATKLGVRDKITLMFNDYNTYVAPADEAAIINFVNKGEATKICDGIGMQSHLDIDYPSPEEYIAAINIFKENNFEIQITEFDATINNKEGNYTYEKQKSTDQAAYVAALMKAVVQAKRDGANITGFTIWGMYDTISWRSQSKPLLFSKYDVNTGEITPKLSFYEFVNAAK